MLHCKNEVVSWVPLHKEVRTILQSAYIIEVAAKKKKNYFLYRIFLSPVSEYSKTNMSNKKDLFIWHLVAT